MLLLLLLSLSLLLPRALSSRGRNLRRKRAWGRRLGQAARETRMASRTPIWWRCYGVGDGGGVVGVVVVVRVVVTAAAAVVVVVLLLWSGWW